MVQGQNYLKRSRDEKQADKEKQKDENKMKGKEKKKSKNYVVLHCVNQIIKCFLSTTPEIHPPFAKQYSDTPSTQSTQIL